MIISFTVSIGTMVSKTVISKLAAMSVMQDAEPAARPALLRWEGEGAVNIG